MKILPTLTFDQKIIALLTFIIALAAIVQASTAMYQAGLMAEAETRNQQREQPNLKILPAALPIVETRGDDDIPKPYVGFDIVNRSAFEITIQHIGLTKGWPIDDNPYATDSVKLPFLSKDDTSDISDVSLPTRLSYGEVLEVRYEKHKIVKELSKWKGEPPLPVRPYCIDSLGNFHYNPDIWMVWTQDWTEVRRGPGPSFRDIKDFFVRS